MTAVGRILSVKVPKKPNEMKSDLQNSTASQGDCSWDFNLLHFQRKAVTLSGDGGDHVAVAVERV